MPHANWAKSFKAALLTSGSPDMIEQACRDSSGYFGRSGKILEVQYMLRFSGEPTSSGFLRVDPMTGL